MFRGFILGASLCRAQEFCADDEQAMLQAKAMKRTPLATEHTSSTSSLLSTIRHLALTVKEQSPETVATLVQTLDDTIQAMKPPLVTEHEAAQSLLDAQFNEISACGEMSSYATNVATFEALVQCRADVNTATTERDEACQLWSGERAILTQQDSYPGCLPDSPAATTEQFLEFVEQWSTFAADELVGLRAKKTMCESKTTTLAEEDARCSEEETEYNDAFCSRASSCTLLHACHDHEVLGYTTLLSTLQSAEAARQAQFRSISQAECLLALVSAAVETNTTVGETSLDTCDGDANVDHLVLQNPDPNSHSVDSTPSLAACPSTTPEDPECDAVEVPDIWNGGEAAPPVVIGREFLLEFCQGARSGQQFRVTIPADHMTYMPSFPVDHNPQDYGPTYCVAGDFANWPAIAWHADRPDQDTDGDGIQGGTRIAHCQRASQDCQSVTGSGMGLYIGHCNREFAGWVNGKYINSQTGCDWCREIPAQMTALGGTGWEIFATMADDESYKFIDTPSIAAPPPPPPPPPSLSQCTAAAFMKSTRAERGVCVLNAEQRVQCAGWAPSVPYTGEAQMFDVWDRSNMCVVDEHNVAHYQSGNGRTPATVENVRLCEVCDHGSCAIMLDGTMQCWAGNGGNDYVPESGLPADFDYGLVKEIHRHWYGACLLLQDNTIRCFGSQPQMSTNYEFGRVPVKRFNARSYGACVLKTDDTFQCWTSSVAVDYPTDLRVKDVSYADRNICAIRMDDDLIQCWGTAAVDPPADFGTAKFLTGFSKTSGGCAVLTSGETKCWGFGGIETTSAAAALC